MTLWSFASSHFSRGPFLLEPYSSFEFRVSSFRFSVNSKPGTRNAKRSLVSELNNSCRHTISHVTRHLEHDRIAGFQTAYHALEVRQRCNRHPDYARNDVAFDQRLLPIGGAQLRREPTWINFFHVEATHSGEMLVSDELLRKLAQRESQV